MLCFDFWIAAKSRSSAAIFPFRSIPAAGVVELGINYYCATGPPDLPIHPASTVLVLRDSPFGPEVFMVRRHEGTAFMGGAHVFPGGRVDAADREAAQVDETWCDGIAHAVAQLA